jgi:alpha-D-ribose 1-methylphosphonate 5-triphosphate synthase subunit PhnG
MHQHDRGKDGDGRGRALGVLARASLEELQAAWSAESRGAAYRLLRAPQIGLVMVRGRVAGTGQPFNLGEMPVTRCAVQLVDTPIVGFGYVAGRDPQRAELVAALDALLQREGPHSTLANRVTTPMAARQRERRGRSEGQAADTRVEFFTMVRGE